MTTDPQELAELLPAPGRPVLSRDRHRVLREHLMQHITHEHDTISEQSTPTATAPRRPARRRLVLVAAPLALAAAVGLGVVAVDNARDGKDGSAAADDHRKAVQLLDRIALAAADRTAVTARDDQFIYTKSQGSAAELGVDFTNAAELAGHKGLFTPKPYNGAVRQEQWDSVDGKADGLRKGVAVADPTRKMVMGMDGSGYLTFRQLQALPVDPDALLKKFSSDARVPAARRTETVVENLGAIVDEATLLPDLSAAIYRAMAELPGVSVVDHVKDAAGREGVGLTFKDAPKGYAWVFDSSSLVYRGTTDSALLGVGVADKAGEVPAG